jgi:hypothetical protein
MKRRTYRLEDLPALEEELDKPVSPGEIERRRKLVDRTLKLREGIGPVSFSIAEAIRAMREGEGSGGDG